MTRIWLIAAFAAACGSESSTQREFAAVVRGRLATTDVAAAKAMHDAQASSSEGAARRLGNYAHEAQLGVAILDGVDSELVLVERWSDGAAMEAHYRDATVFAPLFAGAPTVELFEAQTDWTQWGDMDAGDAFDPYFDHFALGELAGATVEVNRNAHDRVAGGGKDLSIQAGTVAHVVYLGLHDRRRFLAFDLWRASTNMQGFYTNPQFVAAFAPLFESISQPVFQSTDWSRW